MVKSRLHPELTRTAGRTAGRAAARRATAATCRAAGGLEDWLASDFTRNPPGFRGIRGSISYGWGITQHWYTSRRYIRESWSTWWAMNWICMVRYWWAMNGMFIWKKNSNHMISGWKINAIHGLVTALSFWEFHHTKKEGAWHQKKTKGREHWSYFIHIKHITHTHTHIYLHHSYQKVDIPKIETHNLTGVEWWSKLLLNQWLDFLSVIGRWLVSREIGREPSIFPYEIWRFPVG